MINILYIDIALDIQKKIQMGELKVGSKLDSERNMAKQYGVSRNVVREALKFLSQKGLVVVRIGKGTYISKPDATDLAKNFELLLNGSKDDLLKILEVREILDMVVIEKVTLRAEEKDIRHLEEIYEKMDRVLNNSNENAYRKLDEEFHIYLSNMVQNHVMTALITCFNTIILSNLFYLRLLYPERNRIAQQDHRDMIEGIRTQNMVLVKNAMKRHADGLRYEICNLFENDIQ